MVFMRVPAGEFLMGSDTGDSGETPVHPVRISRPFYLSQHVVTQGQWQAVMGNNPSRSTGDSGLPVENVSWNDVQDFIRRLNARGGLGAPSGRSVLGRLFGSRRAQEESVYYRLPTEAEWEYAARAGSTSAYSFGDDARQLGEYAWYFENAGGRTHLVGQKQPNAWGLHDMHGNVWEWVQDWYGPYAAESVPDPQGQASGSLRGYRGGSCSNLASDCRSARRGYNAPGYRHVYLGVRLLRTAP
jgi:formylglycine-generating enzyme required for sulfatase activity